MQEWATYRPQNANKVLCFEKMPSPNAADNDDFPVKRAATYKIKDISNIEISMLEDSWSSDEDDGVTHTYTTLAHQTSYQPKLLHPLSGKPKLTTSKSNSSNKAKYLTQERDDFKHEREQIDELNKLIAKLRYVWSLCLFVAYLP